MKNVNNIFIKIHEIKNAENNLSYKKLLKALASQLNYTILRTAYHDFKPQGFTGVLLLSESHISVHTWPEDHFAILEMVTCKPFSTKERKIIADNIKIFLRTNSIEVLINK